jgi:hypothetical protein
LRAERISFSTSSSFFGLFNQQSYSSSVFWFSSFSLFRVSRIDLILSWSTSFLSIAQILMMNYFPNSSSDKASYFKDYLNLDLGHSLRPHHLNRIPDLKSSSNNKKNYLNFS